MAYPLELRKRVLAKKAQGATQTKIAADLAVSLGWVNKVLQCHAAHGALIPPRRKPGRAPKLKPQHLTLLREWLTEHPELTLAQLAEKMAEQIHGPVNTSNIFQALKTLGYTYKKNDRTRRARTS